MLYLIGKVLKLTALVTLFMVANSYIISPFATAIGLTSDEFWSIAVTLFLVGHYFVTFHRWTINGYVLRLMAVGAAISSGMAVFGFTSLQHGAGGFVAAAAWPMALYAGSFTALLLISSFSHFLAFLNKGRRDRFHRHEFEPPQDNAIPDEIGGLPYWLTQAMNSPSTSAPASDQGNKRAVNNVVMLNDFRK